MRVISGILVLLSGVLALPYTSQVTSNERAISAPKATRDADEVIGNTWQASNPSNDPNIPRSAKDADERVGNTWAASNPSNDPQI